jgi:hypothetical protein
MKTLLMLLVSALGFGQATLTFKPMLGGQNLKLSEPGKNSGTTISVLKFYISNPAFYQKGKEVSRCADGVYLIDASNGKSLVQTVPVPAGIAFDSIGFTFGIDGETNDAGPGEGALDPVRGMYWSWQSGYINFKIEGSRDGVPFTFHLGGFQKPYAAWRTVMLPAGSRQIAVALDVSAFLSAVPKSETTVMSPGEKAMALSDIAVKMFLQ